MTSLADSVQVVTDPYMRPGSWMLVGDPDALARLWNGEEHGPALSVLRWIEMVEDYADLFSWTPMADWYVFSVDEPPPGRMGFL